MSGDHFCYVSDRPAPQQLPIVTPGEGGHPADRGRVEPLVAAAEATADRQALLGLLSMQCHYGTVRARAAGCSATRPPGRCAAGRSWQIVLSTMPWREGACFDVEVLRDAEWEVFDEGGAAEASPDAWSAVVRARRGAV